MFEGNELLSLIERLRGSFFHRADNYLAAASDVTAKTLFTATATATVANTVTETSLLAGGVGTLTLPANFWTVGKTIRLKIFGGWGQTNASPARTVKVYYGATVLANIALPVFATAVTNAKSWSLEVAMTCRTIGAAGNVNTNGLITLFGDVVADVKQYALYAGGAAVDTTASGALDLKWTWGAANAANTIASEVATVEVLN